MVEHKRKELYKRLAAIHAPLTQFHYVVWKNKEYNAFVFGPVGKKIVGVSEGLLSSPLFERYVKHEVNHAQRHHIALAFIPKVMVEIGKAGKLMLSKLEANAWK